MSRESEKQLAATKAAILVHEGMRVGLGTGSTVAYFIGALAQRRVKVVLVATSPASEQAAKALGLEVEPFDESGRLDLAIDGADQITSDGWLVKGAGGALTREKIVAASARRFVVIASARASTPGAPRLWPVLDPGPAGAVRAAWGPRESRRGRDCRLLR